MRCVQPDRCSAVPGCGRWRYIDPSGVTQGPFPAKHMLSWYRKGMLHDMYLPTCGAV